MIPASGIISRYSHYEFVTRVSQFWARKGKQMTEGLQSAGVHFIDHEAKTVVALNNAIQLDRLAMATLLKTRVAVNRELAEQSELGVVKSESGYTLSVLGLVNSVLRFNNLPMVTACMSEDGGDIRLDGIVSYHPVRG